MYAVRVVRRYKTASDACRQTGIYQWGISACCRGAQGSCGGYYWEMIAHDEDFEG
jgi:hypothetical protein